MSTDDACERPAVGLRELRSAFDDQPCVGLFGTCGATTFRQDLFVPAYERRGIPFFNPQVEEWRPELADVEADHLAFDVVQCWPVLGSTYGTGSLAEVGFAVATTLRAPSPLPKFVVVLVDMELDPALNDPVACTESLRSRRLVAAHLAKNPSPNVFVVQSLAEMLEASIALFGAARDLVGVARRSNPAFVRFVEARTGATTFATARGGRQVA